MYECKKKRQKACVLVHTCHLSYCRNHKIGGLVQGSLDKKQNPISKKSRAKKWPELCLKW
jgi:hypothetical protein